MARLEYSKPVPNFVSIVGLPATMPRSCLTIDELECLIKAVEPAAFLVPPRLLRRVIKHHHRIGGFGLLVPHRKGFCLDGQAVLRCVTRAELGMAPSAALPPNVFLLVRPDPARLGQQDRGEVLLKHWRILFHLRIDQLMREKLATGALTPVLVRARIRRLGLTAFAEIKDVLRQEAYLLPPETPESVYAEFVAVYLTLRHFDAARLPHFFPALRDPAEVDALVAEDIDADAILDATRLAGAEVDFETEGFRLPSTTIETPAPALPSNVAELTALVDRLQRAFEWPADAAENWRRVLAPILARGTDGAWSQEARFLSDLQGVCASAEDAIHAVDLMGWALSLGELPVKRLLPGHQEVAMIRRLRQALGRLFLIDIGAAERHELTRLVGEAVEQCERRLRQWFRPLLASALEVVGLTPGNVAEDVGRAKLIEELLDRVVEDGHFSIGNLRDAVSRNQMKLPDIAGPTELIGGDPLIRLNRKLAVSLDGIYRRGEFYMRLLHRLSSVAFGTQLGRWLVLFLILPFGLAFFVMITPGIAIEEGEKLTKLIHSAFAGVGMAEEQPAPAGHPTPHEFPLPNLWGVGGLGVFFLLLFHVAGFRSRFFYALGKVGQGLGRIQADAVGLIHLPAVQAILHNRYWRLFRRCVLWPGLMAVNGGLLAWWLELGNSTIGGVAATGLVFGLSLFNTRVARDLEESVTDRLLRYWAWISVDFLPGLLRLIMDLSRRCLDAVERLLYAVNERLRFRGGENRVVVAGKAVVGLVWAVVAYVVRFAINLLIEPQVNPIKHFPVVTVSHKVCLPMIPTLAGVLRNTTAVTSPTATATAIVFGIPGIFGFMVWELKENWKLYASNRSAALKPVLIGSHGETMLRLLHPGFHSGTIPKLFKRLRRAERHGQQRAIRKNLAELHHVEAGIAHFIERELLALLRRSKGWDGLAVELAAIHLATNQVLVELHCSTLRANAEEKFVFSFDHQGGWLIAGAVEPGWLPRLSVEQQRTLASALAGLYRLAGVQMTREQIAASLPLTVFAFDIADAGLVVWTGPDGRDEFLYDLNGGPVVQPMPIHPEMPALNTHALLLANNPLAWQDWVQICNGSEEC